MQYDILNSHLADALKCLKTYIRTHNKICMKRIYAVTLHLHKDIHDFDHVMSGLPFYWFSLTFFSGVSIVLRAKLFQMTDMSQAIDLYIYLIITNVVLVILIWLLDSYNMSDNKRQSRTLFLILFCMDQKHALSFTCQVFMHYSHWQTRY